MFTFYDDKSTYPYFIAEFNTSHFGDLELAKEMIHVAKNIGVDCVKFQSWTSDTLYSKSYYEVNKMAKRFVKKYSLSEDELKSLAIVCNDLEIGFLSTPYSIKEVDFLIQDCGSNAVKIASMEITNHEFLSYIASTGRNIFLSTGMASIDEVIEAVDVIRNEGNDKLCLFHCVSQYPTKNENANINNLKLLKDTFPDLMLGYSDHTLGFEAANAAVALGAQVLERHFTLDKSKIGMDNNMASEPDEFRQLISSCRSTYEVLGNYHRVVSDEEIEQRKNMRRSVVYSKDLNAGTKLTKDHLGVKRPGTGIAPTDKNKLLGKVLARDVVGDTLCDLKDFKK